MKNIVEVVFFLFCVFDNFMNRYFVYILDVYVCVCAYINIYI